jgi:aspartyl-tRNA(Asn)/glutamyl-tRNA(Gln) amidotransferase subunit A
MTSADPGLADLTIAAAADVLRDGHASSEELTEAVLQRALDTEPIVSAYACLLADQALEQAREADGRGGYDGGLRGIPLSLKDLYDVAGVATTAGSASRAGRCADRDAVVTRRLCDAGAVITGKTHTHEFALGVTTPQSRNAYDPRRTPGGSSGGAGASVAVGSSLGAFGTDTGCSVRLPAALNNLVGLKPTYGLVPRTGVVPLSWSHDHAGPIARTVVDCAMLLRAAAGYDAGDPASRPASVPAVHPDRWADPRGLRVGVPTTFFFDDVAPDVGVAVREAIDTLAGQGVELVDVAITDMEMTLPVVLLASLVEGAAYHRDALRDGAEGIGDEVRALLKAGSLLLGSDYVQARRVRTLVKRAMRSAFDDNRLDAVIVPTSPLTAVPAGTELIADEPVINTYARLCCPFNITGQPAMSVPCGFDGDGMPIGMQIVGRPFDEETVLHLGHAYQVATSWHERRPHVALLGR